MSGDSLRKRILIIDGNSLINRAYYAIQRPMITKDGLYTHAVYGFLNMLLKLQADYEPAYWTVAFDRKAPTFRHLEYGDYKAGRKSMPPELAMQLPLLKEVLSAMNLKTLELDGFEADDLIGTVAKRSEEEGLDPFIITGDRDALQLASDHTTVIITKKGISEFDRFDTAAMQETYGFSPLQFIDYKGLMGDPSDNIPGLPGVGEKTAQKLILEFGSVENLLSNTDKIENEKLRQKVEDNAQLALMSRRLATIETHVPIELSFDELRVREPDFIQLLELYKKLEFNSFIKKLKLFPTASKENTVVETDKTIQSEILLNRVESTIALSKLQTIFESKEFDRRIAWKVFSDFNHTAKPSLEGISILAGQESYYLDLSNESDLLTKFLELLATYNVQIIGHQLQQDYYCIFAQGQANWEPITAFDTAIAQYLLEPARSSYDLGALSLEYFHEELFDESISTVDNPQISLLHQTDHKQAEYGMNWCSKARMLSEVMEPLLLQEGLGEVYYNIELPLIEVLATMEATGFAVDKEELQRTGKELVLKITNIQAEIYALAGLSFNINSPKQLGEVLFEKLNLPAGKKNKTGYSTNADILEGLRGHHKIIDLILEFRTLSKLNSTYVEGLLPLIHQDGKIHAHFQQTVAATGRISCTEPNLQNIPIRQEEGRRLRKAFIPETQDFSLIGADYSQIELRVLAHMSKDPSLIQAFNDQLDIHRATASRVFGVPENEVTALQRSNAKAVNFGVIYGMSGFGLSTELKITRKEAETYIDEYFKKYRKVKEFMDEQVGFCKKNGYVVTIMNRKRPVPEIHASNFMVRQAGERLAMNSPIQGSAADIIKAAMIKCHKQLKNENLHSRLILQVHDELILEVKRDELDYVKKLLVRHMENAIPMDVTLAVDVNTGNDWYELK